MTFVDPDHELVGQWFHTLPCQHSAPLLAVYKPNEGGGLFFV